MLVQGQPVPGESQGACDLPTVGTRAREAIGQYLHAGTDLSHTYGWHIHVRMCGSQVI